MDYDSYDSVSNYLDRKTRPISRLPVETRKLHKLLLYTEEEKREIWKEYGLKEDIVERETEAIMEWFNKQPHLVDAGIEPDSIETLLIIAKGSREKTKQKIDALYKAKTISADIYEGRTKLLEKDFFSCILVVVIPNLHNLERITVIKIADPDFDNFDLLDYFKTLSMIGDFRIKHDYTLADRWIIDCDNFSWFSFLPKMNPMLIQRAVTIFQDSLGIKVAGIHILNAPQSIQNLINILKQFVKPKIMERIIFHNTLDDLYRYIGKDYLPKDFGGTQKSITELAEAWRSGLREETTKKYLIDACNRKSDESKRPGEKTIDPLAGSFKKLDLD